MKQLILCSCLFILGFTQAQNNACTTQRYQQKVFQQVKKTSQILYGSADSYNGIVQPQQLYFDFYEPLGDSLQERPLIIYAFGGAFLIGDKNQPPIPRYCEDFAKMGYAVAAIDYRIGFNTTSTESTIRAVYRAAQDLRAAIRFICQRAAQYRIDTASIILTGSSAGCFSGLHSNYFEENQRPAATYGIPTENTDLGCFDCSGNSDFNKRVPRIAGIVNHWGAILDTSLIENTSDENCPVISFHGTNDNLVPYVYGNPFSYPVFPAVHGSVNIHKRLNNLHIPNKLFPLQNEGHEPWLLKPELLDTIENHTAPFLYNEVLRPKPQKITGDSITCKGKSITISAIQRSRSNYCWSVSAKGVIQNIVGNTITIKCVDTGTITIKVIEENYLKAMSEEVTYKVYVVEKPKADFTFQVNNELGISITNNAQKFTNIYWNFGNGQTKAGSTNSFIYNAPGTYTITQTVSNAGCSDSISKIAQVDTCPIAKFTYQIVGDSLLLFAENTNAVDYKWQINGATFSGQSIVIRLFSNGTFPVSLTTTNQLGCAANTLQFVTKSPSKIETNLLENEITIHPNPFKNWFEINTTNLANATYELLDINGKIQKSGNIESKTLVETSHLARGIYLLKVSIKGKTELYKLIAQ